MKVLGGEEYDSYSFFTSVLYGVSAQSHVPGALPPAPITYEAEWAGSGHRG
jgi:hypothetical protein